MNSLITSRLMYRCPKIYCKHIGQKGETCPKHGLRLILTLSKPNVPRYWIVPHKKKKVG